MGINLKLDSDAWASGQIASKLWLCEKMEEQLNFFMPSTIWILGGWYAQTAFLLFSRNKFNIECVRSFDIDRKYEKTADLINNTWSTNWKFKAFTKDCNKLNFEDGTEWSCRKPDIIINTSCEHFENNKWWDNIPDLTSVIIQANDMKHNDHLFQVHSEDELLDIYNFSRVYFKGSLFFDYGNDTSFTRYMIIGKK